MSKRALVLAVLLVVVSGVVLVGVDRAADPAPAARRGGAAPAPIAAASRRVLERGTVHRYEVSLAHDLRHGTRTESVSTTLSGTWTVGYAGESERGPLFRAELVAAGNAASGRAYYFTTTAEGRVIDLAFPPDLGDAPRGVLTTLAATFQRTERTTPAFEATETDTFGRYRARYTRTAHGLHRDRIAYDSVVGDGVLAASVVATGTDFALRSDGWPAEVTGTEATRIGTEQVEIHVSSKFTLRHAGVTRGVALGSPDGYAILPVDAAGRGRSQAELDRELVDGAAFADLLAELAKLGDDTHARGFQLLRLAALFRLDDSAARAAGEHVRGGGADAALVIGALGEAGSPAAQRALGELVTDAPADARLQASAALGLTAAPTPDTLRTLATAARGDGDLAATATLAQGNAALRLGDDPAAREVVDALLARLDRTTDPAERELVVRALGNTGDPRIVAPLDRVFTTEALPLQVAATESLRLVPGVDAILAARLDHPASAVRIAAVFTISGRTLAPYLAVLERRARTDVDTAVRQAIVDLASARRGEHAVLERIAAPASESR